MTRRWGCRARSARTSCFPRRSCSTPTARKSGATSAISTGRPPKQLSFSRKRARRGQPADQAAVDRGQAQCNQAKAQEVLRRQRLAEEQGAEQDRDRRHKQGDQQRIGRTRRLDQPKVEYIAERRAEERERGDRG